MSLFFMNQGPASVGSLFHHYLPEQKSPAVLRREGKWLQHLLDDRSKAFWTSASALICSPVQSHLFTKITIWLELA